MRLLSLPAARMSPIAYVLGVRRSSSSQAGHPKPDDPAKSTRLRIRSAPRVPFAIQHCPYPRSAMHFHTAGVSLAVWLGPPRHAKPTLAKAPPAIGHDR